MFEDIKDWRVGGKNMLMGEEPTEVIKVSSVEEWEQKAYALRSIYSILLGETPAEFAAVRAEPEVGDAYPYKDVLRRDISFSVGPNERLVGHLLYPQNAPAKLPLILTLHQTHQAGKDFSIGADGAIPDDTHPKAYGLGMARRGFMTFSYDQFSTGLRAVKGASRHFGTEPFNAAFPDWSARGKDILDMRMALDAALAAPGVDVDRIGSMGHSQGGGLTIDGMIFDDRIKAGVSNCGSGSWRTSINPFGIARNAWWIGIQRLRPFFQTGKLAPIDLHERLALIAPRHFLYIAAANEKSYGVGPNLPWNESMLDELAVHTRSIYALYGKEDNFSLSRHREGHDFKPHHMDQVVGFFRRCFNMQG